jgi:hypothetical protein
MDQAIIVLLANPFAQLYIGAALRKQTTQNSRSEVLQKHPDADAKKHLDLYTSK